MDSAAAWPKLWRPKRNSLIGAEDRRDSPERRAAKAIFTGDKAFHLYETFGPAARLHGRCGTRRRHCLSTRRRLRSAPAPKSKPAPAPVGKAAAKNPPAPPFAICPRPTSSATSSSPPTNAEVLAIVKDGVGVPAAAAGDAGRSRARPHQLLRRLRRSGRRHRLVHLRRRQHHRRRNSRLRAARAGRPRPQGPAQAAARRRRPRQHRRRWRSAATPSAAITPERTCCTRRCARFWART